VLDEPALAGEDFFARQAVGAVAMQEVDDESDHRQIGVTQRALAEWCVQHVKIGQPAVVCGCVVVGGELQNRAVGQPGAKLGAQLGLNDAGQSDGWIGRERFE